MRERTKDYAENAAYADVLYYRHEYEALLEAKAAIEALDDFYFDHSDGFRGRIDIDITVARINRSIKDCEQSLRSAEKYYYGI